MAIAVTLGLVEMLKNSDFVLENKMAELNIKIQNYKIDQMLCETLFYLGNKWIAYLTQLFDVFTESLYWTFRKSFEEAVKLGSFLQCSTYIFLGHENAYEKLIILWNHAMKNFQGRHTQRDCIKFCETFSLGSSK